MKKETTAIVKVDPEQYGLKATEALNIEKAFKPMIDTMVELEKEYNDVIDLPVNQENLHKFRELRLKYVKARTSTAAIHKTSKSYFLNAGRFIDGWKNTQEFASQGKEEELSKKENHFINLEKERIAKLTETRTVELSTYMEILPEGLGNMADEVFEILLSGAKKAFEEKQKAEKIAAKEKEKADKAEKKRLADQEKENKRLKALEEKRQKEIAQEKQLKIKQAEKYSQVLATAGFQKSDDGSFSKSYNKDSSTYVITYESLIEMSTENFNQRFSEITENLDKDRIIAEQNAEQLRLDTIMSAPFPVTLSEVHKPPVSQPLSNHIDFHSPPSKGMQPDKSNWETPAVPTTNNEVYEVLNLVNDLVGISQKFEGKFTTDKNIKMFNDVKILLGKIITHIRK